jgi:hypothetical protein
LRRRIRGLAGVARRCIIEIGRELPEIPDYRLAFRAI